MTDVEDLGKGCASQACEDTCASKPADANKDLDQIESQIKAAQEQLAKLQQARSSISDAKAAEPAKAITKAPQKVQAWDGNTATAHVAYAMTENAFIFPITPSSPMSEQCEMWAVQGVKNIFGSPMNVQQLQSEAGAAGALHGSVTSGGLGTTFTSSQGLLLMIPNMYKISGELLPCVIHVAARALAGEGLSIFGDHQDVMAVRAAGWGMLASQSVQDCHDMGLVAHVATLKARVPIVHFQDGFRTSHEINTIETLSTENIRTLLDLDALRKFRQNGLSPLRPVMRGSNQNPDIYMQAVEAANTYYLALPAIIEEAMEQVSALTGRPLSLVRYTGDKDAEHIIVQMGSGVKVTESVVSHFQAKGEKVGVLSPLLFRPWPAKEILKYIPATVKTVTVLDRTKEHGAFREPLFLDIAATLQADVTYAGVTILGGRYGLGSKEYTPSMAATVFENAMGRRKDRFTVGIEDDVTFTNLPLPKTQLDLCLSEQTFQCVFYGLAGDGTVGANKSACKIIGDNSKLKSQAYFAYTSVKNGVPTVSHVRFGPDGVEAPYLTLPGVANYVACSFTEFLNSLDMLHYVKENGTFVLNCPWTKMEEFEAHVPQHVKKIIGARNISFYAIDASRVAQESGMGKLTNNIMQTAFFNLSKVLPIDDAMKYFRESIAKTYKKHGEVVIQKNLNAVEKALENLIKVDYPKAQWAALDDAMLPAAEKYQNHGIFVEKVQGPMVMMKGDDIPVSSLPVGGTAPLGSANWDKKAQADEVPEVDMDKCTQCNYCSLVCPHGVIRPFLMDQNTYDSAPQTLVAKKATSSEQAGYYFRIQVSAKDCTGCKVCVKTCPSDALKMISQAEAQELKHDEHWSFLRALPVKEDLMRADTVKGSQMQQPLLEFSAACTGCGETPYMKLLTQMFGERMVIANATGCSSIWGNPYGDTPYTKKDSTGHGPAWQNSLFEDNAEFGFGMAQSAQARRAHLHNNVGELLKTTEIDNIPQLRSRLAQWQEKWKSAGTCNKLQEVLPPLLEKAKEAGANSFAFQEVYEARESFIKTSQWIIGGDGWAYDIGFGGLDHVVASGANVNILVLDTEAYSNTGGQRSKATPAGAIAKFAMGGKERQKKNLGEICMSYGNVFVASIALGANMTQTVKAFAQAEEYDGPSIILAYAPCIEFKIMHKDGMGEMINAQKLAVSSGYWPLYRFDPRKETPMQLDQKSLKDDLAEYLLSQNRFNALRRTNPDRYKELTDVLRLEVRRRHRRYLQMSSPVGEDAGEPLSILYGSETGNTAELAARFAGNCKSRGYAVELAELNDLSVEDLAQRKQVVIMIPTCGEGAIPQNAQALYDELCRAEPGCLSGVRYSVFALGDHSYRHFCSAGKDYARVLKELGATQIMDMGIGDDKDEDKFETGFAQWMPSWVVEVKAPEDPKENEPPAPLFALTPANKNDALEGLARPPFTQPLLCSMNKRISPADYPYSIRHMKFEDPEHRLPYMLGDALGVHWTNDEARVKKFLQEYGLDGEECYTASALEDANPGVKAERLDGTFKVSSMFVEMLDIFGRPSKNFLKDLSKVAPPGADKERLQFLVSEAGNEAYTKEINGEGLNFADVLLKFPSAKPTLNQLLTMIPVIKPRLYTIASSTRLTPGFIELTVITNTWMTTSRGELTGSCTDFFERHDTEKNGPCWMNCSISPGSFKFGEPDVPMVMTGTGTGVAPFLAFARERDWYIRNNGPEHNGEMWLFFGCRNRRSDYILGDELEDLSKRGVLSHLMPAFSRDGPKKVYIQNKIEEQAEGVYKALVEKKGYLYLCGQAGDREKDVLNAVTKAFEVGGKMPAAQAKQLLDELIEDGRYCPELY